MIHDLKTPPQHARTCFRRARATATRCVFSSCAAALHSTRTFKASRERKRRRILSDTRVPHPRRSANAGETWPDQPHSTSRRSERCRASNRSSAAARASRFPRTSSHHPEKARVAAAVSRRARCWEMRVSLCRCCVAFASARPASSSEIVLLSPSAAPRSAVAAFSISSSHLSASASRAAVTRTCSFHNTTLLANARFCRRAIQRRTYLAARACVSLRCACDNAACWPWASARETSEVVILHRSYRRRSSTSCSSLVPRMVVRSPQSLLRERTVTLCLRLSRSASARAPASVATSSRSASTTSTPCHRRNSSRTRRSLRRRSMA